MDFLHQISAQDFARTYLEITLSLIRTEKINPVKSYTQKCEKNLFPIFSKNGYIAPGSENSAMPLTKKMLAVVNLA